MKVYKWINENIYGSIPVTKTEFDLINTKAFQRLRNIKQLGLAHLVFPTADHSRFSHSLGVMHIVGRMAAHLHEHHEIFSPEEVDKLRIAGLLHDIGHYPLSHLGEKVYQLLTKKEAKITKKRKGPNNKSEENILHIASKELKQEDVSHEKLGEYVILNREEIKKILERDGFDPNEIAQIINGEHINLAYDQLIHSGLDADRLDYLLRDTTQTGAKYGLVDLDYIIRMLSVGRDENNNVWIGIDKRAIHSIEHFLLARYFSYSQVTWHRTIRGFEIMATALFYEMAKRGMVYDSFDQLKRIVNTDDWINFNDNYFNQKISEFSNRTNSELCNILLSNLNSRR
ncbi:MAG: HD domain-containing protein, partial [Deferribacterales bacterium]|nr:HD domain-containing protein [Deferribacterales bacterium]